MSELRDSLQTLKEFGLLNRATQIKVGDVALSLVPEGVDLTPDERKKMHDDLLFAASQ